MINRAGLGIASGLSAAALYGLVPNFTRAGFVNGIPPIESTLVRTSAVIVIFAIIAVLRSEVLRVPRAAVPSFIGQTVATLMVSIGYLMSVQFIPVGLAAIFFFFFPVLIMLLAPVAEGRNPGISRISIGLAAFVGLAIAVGPSFETLDIRGVLLAVMATIGAVMQFFTGRSISRYMTPSVFGCLVHLAIWPAILAIALTVGSGKLQFMPGGTGTPMGLAFMAGLGAVYVVSYMMQMLSLRFVSASIVAPFYNLEPVVTTGIAALTLGERLLINQYAGGGLVLAALVASSLVGRWKS